MITYRSIPLPPKKSKGEDIKASEYNMLIDALKLIVERQANLQVVTSNEIGVKADGGVGTMLYLKNSPAKNSSTAATIGPLTLVSARPPYVPAGTAIASGSFGTWLTWGFCNGVLPTNWATRIDSVSTGTYNKYFKLKVNLVSDDPSLKVTTCEWEAWATEDEKSDAAWGENGENPAYIYVSLGMIMVIDGVPNLIPAGAGDLSLISHVSYLSHHSTNGYSYRRSITTLRQVY